MNSSIKNRIPVFILIFLGLLISFGIGFSFGKNSVECKVCKPENLDFSLFWEAFQKIQEKYVDPGKIDVQQVIYGAISGMVNSLDDPYTVFLSPDQSKKFLEDVSGRFEGIGVEVGIRDGDLQVISPLIGTPAFRAGLQSGDKIVKIDDVFTADISIDEAVSLIRGQRGTEVILTIFRNGWDSTQEIKIVRGVIEIPSLEWKLIDGNVAHIKLYQFSEKASDDFQKIALEIINSKASAIVLDLRNNPGGYLEVSEDIAGWFLEKGDTVVIEDFGETKEQKIYTANGSSRLAQYPMVVMINGGSASASEILAGALRDNRDIKLIGEKSFGKGSIQELEKLKGGAILKITIARWLTPNGTLIAEHGLEPDVVVEEDDNSESDLQLDRALEEIKKIM